MINKNYALISDERRCKNLKQNISKFISVLYRENQNWFGYFKNAVRLTIRKGFKIIYLINSLKEMHHKISSTDTEKCSLTN